MPDNARATTREVIRPDATLDDLLTWYTDQEPADRADYLSHATRQFPKWAYDLLGYAAASAIMDASPEPAPMGADEIKRLEAALQRAGMVVVARRLSEKRAERDD